VLPDEAELKRFLEGARFLQGQDRQRWRLLGPAWPHATIAVSAAERANAPSEYSFRFECSNYPQSAPTACPWDSDADTPLPRQRWPGGIERVARAFNPDWNAQALYLPCDRLAMAGHDPWLNDSPAWCWNPSRDLALYLGVLDELLDSRDYQGLRGS
jgi:hypothetical protein